jgi:NADPH:quinone reductase-like Zn-dependent oxidoreductase
MDTPAPGTPGARDAAGTVAVLLREGAPLALERLPLPAPRAGEARVRLRFAALNHRDLWMRKGAYGKMAGPPCAPGSDGFGVVEATGDPAHAAWVGREVVINPSLDWGDSDVAPGPKWRILGVPDAGTWARHIVVSVSQLFAAPAHLSPEEAAALPLAGLTAHRALFRRGGLKAGQRVLVTGIGGGVARFALSFARAAGAEVWVTSGSEEKLRAAVAAGARGGVLHTAPGWGAELARKAGGAFDLCVDSAGGSGWQEISEALGPGGRLVFLGATRGTGELFMRKAFFKQLDVLGTAMGSPNDFREMLAFVGAHALRPAIDSIFGLEDAEKALARMDAGEQTGKIVLRIPD